MLGWLARLLLAAVALGLAFGAVLAAPYPLFEHRFVYGPYEVWSDRPIPEAATRRLLDEATRRISRSELWSPDQRFRIFFCNEEWRLALYSQRFNGRMGGVADNLITRNVYLREADIERGVLIPPGRVLRDAADRPLAYFVAHELTHVMQARRYGRLLAVSHPRWLVEGYADYVAKAGRFDLAANRRLLMSGAPELDYARSGLYRRHHLMVQWLLEVEGRDLDSLFARPPREAEVLARIVEDRPARNPQRLAAL